MTAKRDVATMRGLIRRRSAGVFDDMRAMMF